MYERASMAAKTCKGKYNDFYGYYDKDMRRATFREQEIVNEMEEALATGQFVPYLQPKYDLKTIRPYGAEALVRWIHPQKGVISPGEFIPIFEGNGFIGKLDYYMWESVCRILRRWLDEKRNPAPISVNISRANMYNPKIVEIIANLTDSYQVPPSLLNLELTESAYMDNPDVMKEVVRRLQEKGFLVMMDDFGSGYSSLNTLKEITVDVLKIDMNFLRGDDGTGRSERILSSMIRMAGWLGIPVVVEGVETREQVDFLKSVGCGYIQGYYFARPMPVPDYEALVGDTDVGVKKKDVSADLEKLSETIWTSDPHIAFLLNHFFQPVAVFECSGSRSDVTMLRVNDAFNDFFGYGNDIMKQKEGKTADAFRDLFRRVDSTKNSDSCILDISDQTGAGHPMQVILNYMGEVENRTVLCAIFMERNRVH